MSVCPAQRTAIINGAEIAWVEWGDRRNPTMLLSHATGFHSRCWDEVVKYLDGYFVLAIDHRGHGKSDKAPPYSFSQIGSDLTEFIRLLGLDDIIGVGHSMGGHCLVQAAASASDRFKRLTLFDPVIFHPSVYKAAPSIPVTDHPVSRRRHTWDSPSHMLKELKKRPPFSRWQSKVLRDYCDHGLVPSDGVFELSCPPSVEVALYESAPKANIHCVLSQIDVPVTVVRARPGRLDVENPDFSLSPTWPELANQLVNGRDEYRPEHSHFLPMESPELAAWLIDSQLAADAYEDKKPMSPK